jgi:hypothetical protein
MEEQTRCNTKCGMCVPFFGENLLMISLKKTNEPTQTIDEQTLLFGIIVADDAKQRKHRTADVFDLTDSIKVFTDISTKTIQSYHEQ